MKGLMEWTTGEGVFLTVKHNSIVRESKTERPGFESIEVTNPRTNQKITKFIKRYKGIEALIKKIDWYDTEQRYEQRYIGWKITLDADGEKCIFDIPFDSRVCSRFMNLAENLDFTQPVEFSAWRDSTTDSTAFAVKQNGQSVPQKYTRANPGDRPEPIQNFKGNWNYDAQMEFLKKKMIDVVIPAVEAAQSKQPETRTDATAAKDDHSESNGSNGNGNASTAKLLDEIKGAIKALAGTDEVKGASKSELLEDYFGTANWSEIEVMHPDLLLRTFRKLDDLIPF